MQETVGMQYNR